MLHYEQKVLNRLCDEVATPVAYKASILLNAGDWQGLLSMKVDPGHYCSAEHFLRDAQVVSLLRKHPSLPLPPETAEKAALDAFRKAEVDCYWTNERLNPLLNDLDHYGEDVGRVFRRWRKEIKHVLRTAPNDLNGRFGPGSTFANKGDLITIPDKLTDDYTTTRQTLKAVSHIWDRTAWSRYAAAGLCPFSSGSPVSLDGIDVSQSEELYAPRDFKVVLGNRFTTVEKTALTKRGICIEPSLNLFYQLALGRAIENRLGFAYGWRKSSIQEYHRLLARLGSLTGSNATIDLASASDTVSKVLVKLLLPPDWFNLLNQLRSPYTLVKGKWEMQEKFSSMGNGFTFELETLIFYTLCKTIQRLRADDASVTFGSDVSCFGDDIIVPRQMANDVIQALRFCGFTVNKSKTFIDGPFRESCGGDYFRGSDVRPHFIKKELSEPHRIISAINGLMRYRDRLGDCGGDTGRCSYLPWLINKLPRQIRRCRGPRELGDQVIYDPDPGTWVTTIRNSIRYVRVWRPVSHRPLGLEIFRPGVQLALALYGTGSTGGGSRLDPFNLFGDSPPELSRVIPRITGSYVSGYRFGRVPYS